eukprot:764539-Hanusia_phi.AAC.13
MMPFASTAAAPPNLPEGARSHQLASPSFTSYPLLPLLPTRFQHASCVSLPGPWFYAECPSLATSPPVLVSPRILYLLERLIFILTP